MSPNRQWILIITGAICIALTVIGIVSHPSLYQNPLELLGYSIGIPLGIIAILLLVYFRGLPEEPEPMGSDS
jgi:hypothetical protein